MVTVLFDSILRTKRGTYIPFWETSYMEEATDNELVWFHEGYGMMKLYRLLQVDDKNFINIAERAIQSGKLLAKNQN